MHAPLFAQKIFAEDRFRAVVRPALRLTREIPVRFDLLKQAGRGPMAVFLPSAGREGASLLRIYHVARELRPLGWRTLVVPCRLTLGQRHRLIAAARPDVLVMQGARHALNRPALYPGLPVAFDMDDADFHLPHLSRPVRRAMPDVGLVLAGSEYIARWCRSTGAGDVRVVWTGAPVSALPPAAQSARPPVLAWAQTRPMTYRREADLVRRVARAVAAAVPGVRLRLFDRQPGDDPAFARSFAAPGLDVEWIATRPYGGYLAALGDVAVGLAPLCPETPFSRGKSFGKVLAYIDAGVPVIASDACEHGAFFTDRTGVITNDPDAWAAAAIRLLGDAAARQRIADAARTAFRERLSSAAAAARVDRALRDLIGQKTT